MNLELVNLILLQKLDSRLENLKRVEREGPLQLEKIGAELMAAETKVSDSLSMEKEMTKRKRELETEIEDHETKIKNNQSRQLQVKTNEEYRAMLKENDFLKKAKAEREDQVLELMEKLEELTKENKKLKVWLEEQRKIAAQKQKEIQTAIDTSLADQGVMNIDRESLIKDIPRTSISLYNKVYNGRKGRAVVPILDGICQECHLQIPPQDYIDLQKNEKLMTCPHCQRIIFWGEHKDFENIM